MPAALAALTLAALGLSWIVPEAAGHIAAAVLAAWVGAGLRPRRRR